jgi:di/tricarboxylate transporter
VLIANVVLANEQFKWFYWIGFFLAVGAIGLLVMLLVGYYVRVLKPKWRGREVK